MNDYDDVIANLSANVMGLPVFKRASSGATQVWRVEQDGNKFRTIHGQLEGAMIVSEWTICEGKNIGKKNETSPEEQAKLEVEALYKKKTAQGKYFYNVDDIDIVTFVSPMLAEKFTPAKMVYPCNVQPKLDGMRCIATKAGFFSRKGKEIPVLRHLQKQLEPLFKLYPDLILDGEIYNHKLKEDFEELISLARQNKPTEEDFIAAEKLNFHVYDAPSINGGYYERWIVVGDLLGVLANGGDGEYGVSTNYPNVFFVDIWDSIKDEETIKDRFEGVLEKGYEGLIIRLDNMEYETKRTYQLQKYKNFIDEEFEVADIREGKGNWAGHAKIAVLWLPGADKTKGIIEGTEEDDTVFRAGVKGNKKYAKKLLELKDEVIGKDATVTYFRKTAYGVPYLPIFKVIRDYE